jgi:PAS domain S-box-containing protein
MSVGLVLMVAEALLVYAAVFSVHALRRRYTLVPYYVVLGVLAASLWWTTDLQIYYTVGPLTFYLGSVVFFTALLFGIFLLYVFDGVKATQFGIYIVLFVSVLMPIARNLLRYQIWAMDPVLVDRISVAPPHSYVVSSAAMLFDFLCVAVLWEAFNRYVSRTPVLLRTFFCLWVGYSLDTLIYTTGTFWEDPNYASILQGNLISRVALSTVVAPLLTVYILWERKRQNYQITPRPLMAILRQSARMELDLSAAREEIETRIQVEEELRRRDAILESLAYTAEHVLALGEGLVNVAGILEALGKATNTSRVYLCRNYRDEAGRLCSAERHVWNAASLSEERRADSWRAVSFEEAGLARWETVLRGGEVIFGNVRSFPREERHQLIARGTVSILVLPVFVQEEWWGFLGLEECSGTRAWPRSEIDALRTTAATLGAAIQRARIETELRESEERLELAIDGGGLGLWDWDLDRGHVVFNVRWAEMLGYALEDIEHSPAAWQRLIHPKDFEATQSGLHEFLRGDVPIFEMEFRMRAKSGDWYWILNRGKVVSWSAPGRASRALGTHLDITRLKQTEEALRFSQEMFRLMFEESPLGLMLCTMDGAFVQANPAYLQMIDYTQEEAMSLTYWDVTPPDYALEEAAVLRNMRESGRYGPYEKEYVRKGGEHVPVLLNGCLVQGADGNQYIWSIVQDISVRKASEQVLAEARRYEREIETRIEETLLRGRPPTSIAGADIAALSEATQHMDGDFAEFVTLAPQCFDVLVGDVMGKGILAALVGAGTKSHYLHALTAQLAEDEGSGRPLPSALVAAVHEGIVRQLIDLERFLTLFYARFDLDRGLVTYVDCGHTKAIRYRVEEDRWEFLAGDNVPLGFLEREAYHDFDAEICPGDLFFFYSDGISEARNSDGSMFGVDRLIQCLQTYASLDATSLTEAVVRAAGRFSGAKTSEDDQTCVAVAIAPLPEALGSVGQFSIAPSTSALSEARDSLSTYLEDNGALLGHSGEVSGIVLGFVEALSNTIKHAQDDEEDIQIEFRATRNRVHIGIVHSGAPFLPRLTHLPDVGPIRESGYGLYIMNRSFDHIGYDSLGEGGSQRVILVKYFCLAGEAAE